jgi:hypothetical protein
LNVAPVTFYPVPPVKPVVYPKPDAPAEERAPPRALTPSHVGRNLDLKV